MNHAIPFDTYESANILLAAGVPKEHVHAQIEVIKKNNAAINSLINNDLSTKHDVELIRKDIAWIMIGGGILGAIIIAGLGLLIMR